MFPASDDKAELSRLGHFHDRTCFHRVGEDDFQLDRARFSGRNDIAGGDEHEEVGLGRGGKEEDSEKW